MMSQRAALPLAIAGSVLLAVACHRSPAPAPAKKPSAGHPPIATTSPTAPDTAARPSTTAPGSTRWLAPASPLAPPPSTALAITPPPIAAPRPPRGTMLSLVYGGNRQGEIEPCG